MKTNSPEDFYQQTLQVERQMCFCSIWFIGWCDDIDYPCLHKQVQTCFSSQRVSSVALLL